MNNSNKYSLISIIDGEQIIKLGYPNLTTFSLIMSRKLKDSPLEYEKYYRVKNSRRVNEDCENYILLKSAFGIKDKEKVCLSAKNMDQYEINAHKNHYKERYVGQQFGIVPIIPYNWVSNIVKKTGNHYYKSGVDSYEEYTLGYYPKKIIDFDFKYSNFIFGNTYHDILVPYSHAFNMNSFSITEDKFSLPSIIEDELVIEHHSVYHATTSNGKEIRAIKYSDEWFSVEPVKWIKIGDNLVCEDVLFESPVHMKNDYIQNDDIKSFDDTFLKWYIDNIFTNDLFKYTDLSCMKEQIPLAIDEDIETKVEEIERLKQIKANIILQQQNEQNNQQRIVDIADDSIMDMLGNEEDIARVKSKIR